VVDASYDEGARYVRQPGGSRYLASIANLPLIAHVLDGLAHGGITQVLIVAGDKVRRELGPIVGGGEAWGVKVSFIPTGHDRDPQVLISHIREAVASGPVMLHSGDCLFPGQVGSLQDCFRDGDLDLVLLVNSNARRAPSVVRRLGTKPGTVERVRLPRDRPQGTAMIVGPAVWPVLAQLSNHRMSVARLIESLRSSGHRVGTCEVGEHWCYCASPERLLDANRMLLDALPFDASPAGLSDDSDAQGRVVIGRSAHLARSTLRGPVLIGADAVVEDSFIGPYTAIGPGARVVGAEIDYAMVLAGAQVRYPGHRLEASVIGERAVVSKSFELPTGMHLRIGPDARVILG
jgi:glucose-1-phosphate thymidylyltransferase